MSDHTFGCPNCGATLRAGAAACERCGLRLTGPTAGRLWQVDQELERLREERSRLLATLLGPADDRPVAASAPAPTAVAARRRLSGQQLLLGLGALLLLAAASFFLVVVWIVVGLVGQAVIMSALTLGAAAGARWAAGRALPAAAETGAVLTTGLLLIDTWAAHDLGLAGLDAVDLDAYGAVAAPVLAAFVLLADGWVRSTRNVDVQVRTYRPAATAMAALVPWCLLSVLGLHGDVLLAGLGVVALLDAAVAVAAARWFPRPRGAAPAPALLGAGLAAVGFVIGGAVLGYDPYRALLDRWGAAGVLVAGLVAALLLERRRPAGRLPRAAYLCAGLVAAVALGVPLLDAPVAVLAAIAVLAAAAAIVRGRLLVPALAVVAAAYAGVAVLRTAAEPSLHALLRAPRPFSVPPLDGRDVLLMLVPAVAGLVATVAAAGRARTWPAVAFAQIALLVTAVTALLAAPAGAWTVTMAALALAQVGLAGVCAGSGTTLLVVRRIEETGLAAATVYGVVAVVSAADISAERAAAVLVLLGIAVLGYAALPARLPFAYVGSGLVSAGMDTWLATSDVDLVEAYSLPLAGLLAAVGFVQWRSDRRLPTTLTVAPALWVALLPSAVTAVDDGDAVRLAVVTAVALVALLAGLSRMWRAPVTVGAVVLALVALTQGGPLIAYVPGWLTMGLAGAVLLAAGVAWERAVLAGRRAHAWYATLH